MTSFARPSHAPADIIRAALEVGDISAALALYEAKGGPFFAQRHGYAALGEVLDAMPRDLWKLEESVLGGLVLYLVKHGRAGRARAYLDSPEITFEKSALFDLFDLLVAIHLGGLVSEERLAKWLRLERRLPVADPLPEGLFHNAILVILVRLSRHREARAAGQRAISCYREAGHDYLEHFIHLHLADLDVVEGRLRAARRGVAAAEECLVRWGATYGNEHDLVAIVRLSIDYECGRMEHILDRACALRRSLLSGDSWAELFVQLGRIAVLSTFFLKGRSAAVPVLEQFQADYARRHGGSSGPLDLLGVTIDRLDWRPQEAERGLSGLSDEPLQSAIGSVLWYESHVALGLEDPQQGLLSGPRGQIIDALHAAERTQGPERRRNVQRALWTAAAEGQTAPFFEHRDVFAGLGAHLSSGQFARGNRTLARMTGAILRAVDRSRLIPPELAELGLSHRQYRVVASLQEGATNKQIARRLGITEATVKYHLTALYKRTGFRGRSQLIEFMYENRIFEEN